MLMLYFKVLTILEGGFNTMSESNRKNDIKEMMKKKINQSNLLFVLILFFLASCGSTAPLKERDLARTKLDQANQVKAGEFAKPEYDSSNNSYEEGESLIELEKQSAQNTEAQKAYLKAIADAEIAYNKSVDPYTKSLLDNFSKQVEQTRSEKIQNAVRDEYGQMTDAWDNAKQAYEAKEYLTTIEAVPDLMQELEALLKLTRELKMDVDAKDKEVISLIDEVMKEKAPVATPDEYEQSQETYANIKEQSGEGFYRESLAEYPGLVEELENILSIIAELKMLVAVENEKIDGLFSEAQRNKAKAATPDELRQNQQSYSAIKKLNQDGYYRQSLDEYPSLTDEIEKMLALIEEKRLLALQAIKEAEEKISSVQSENENLDEEISSQY